MQSLFLLSVLYVFMNIVIFTVLRLFIAMSIPVMNFNFFYCFNIHTQLSCVCCSMAVVYESTVIPYPLYIRNVSGLFQLFCFDMSEHTLQPSDHLILHVSASYFGNNTTNQRRSISDGSYTRQALTAATPGFWTPFYYMS